MNEQAQIPADPLEMVPQEESPQKETGESAKPKFKKGGKSARTHATEQPDPGSKEGSGQERGEIPAPAEEEALPLETPCEPAAQPDAAPPADPPAGGGDPQELGRLREELNQLREEIASARRSLIEEEAELEEFRDLWPDVSLSSLPDAVLRDMKNGVPLAAAYALNERRNERLAKVAAAANAANRARSSGSAEGECSGFLSPAEVRAMSPEQVRKQYRQILLSMPKWH